MIWMIRTMEAEESFRNYFGRKGKNLGICEDSKSKINMARVFKDIRYKVNKFQIMLGCLHWKVWTLSRRI